MLVLFWCALFLLNAAVLCPAAGAPSSAWVRCGFWGVHPLEVTYVAFWGLGYDTVEHGRMPPAVAQAALFAFLLVYILARQLLGWPPA